MRWRYGRSEIGYSRKRAGATKGHDHGLIVDALHTRGIYLVGKNQLYDCVG